MPSAHLTLAQAAISFRGGHSTPLILDTPLSSAQAGAALRLFEVNALTITSAALSTVSGVQKVIDITFSKAGASYRQAFHEIHSESDLQDTLGIWLADFARDTNQANLGYWLMSVFLRGLADVEAEYLTEFLVDNSVSGAAIFAPRSVRRYPTGGISEKQALILPAFLRYLAADLNLSSSFLIARRLAHTGGTYDKLCALPGIQFPSTLAMVEKDNLRPIRYFTASRGFCARDETLYRIRGETGTVADIGLMASSVMAKQISFPTQVIVLDILFGNTAFLKSKSEAETFAALCQRLGNKYSVSTIPYLRESDASNGECIGNVLEMWEAIKLLMPQAREPSREINVALDFVEIFCEQLNEDAPKIRDQCLQRWQQGEILVNLYQLWLDHNVDKRFIQMIRKDPRAALLGNLNSVELVSSRAGIVTTIDNIALADIANNRLNSYTMKDSRVTGFEKGGIELLCGIGEFVEKGTPLARAYASRSFDNILLGELEGSFTIKL